MKEKTTKQKSYMAYVIRLYVPSCEFSFFYKELVHINTRFSSQTLLTKNISYATIFNNSESALEEIKTIKKYAEFKRKKYRNSYFYISKVFYSCSDRVTSVKLNIRLTKPDSNDFLKNL